jgi:hypothetical protein
MPFLRWERQLNKKLILKNQASLNGHCLARYSEIAKKGGYPLATAIVVFSLKIQARDCHMFTHALALIHVTSLHLAFLLPFA